MSDLQQAMGSKAPTKKWSPAQHKKFKATMAAKKTGKKKVAKKVTKKKVKPKGRKIPLSAIPHEPKKGNGQFKVPKGVKFVRALTDREQLLADVMQCASALMTFASQLAKAK